MRKLNKTWDEWVKKYDERFGDDWVRYEKGVYDDMDYYTAEDTTIRAEEIIVNIIESFGITDRSSMEFKLACVVCSIIKWSKARKLPSFSCGLCTYSFLWFNYNECDRPCEEKDCCCNFLYEIFDDLSDEELEDLCRVGHSEEYKEDLIFDGLYDYYTREYKRFMKNRGEK